MDDNIDRAFVDRYVQEILDDIDDIMIAREIEDAREQSRADYDRAMGVL